MPSKRPPRNPPPLSTPEEAYRNKRGEPISLEERVRELEVALAIERAKKDNGSWLGTLFQGLTLATIVGAAFWLGGIKTALQQNTDKVDKMYGVTLEAKDSLASRTSSIETSLSNIEKGLAKVEIRLGELSSALPTRRTLQVRPQKSSRSGGLRIAKNLLEKGRDETNAQVWRTMERLSGYTVR